MNRRRFLRHTGAGSLALLASIPFSRPGRAGETPAVFDSAALLESDDPVLLKLVQDVFRECVLGKVRPPEGVIQRPWITAGGHFYGQWLWDTMFVADLLALLPDTRQTLRDVFQNFWDFQ